MRRFALLSLILVSHSASAFFVVMDPRQFPGGVPEVAPSAVPSAVPAPDAEPADRGFSFRGVSFVYRRVSVAGSAAQNFWVAEASFGNRLDEKTEIFLIDTELGVPVKSDGNWIPIASVRVRPVERDLGHGLTAGTQVAYYRNIPGDAIAHDVRAGGYVGEDWERKVKLARLLAGAFVEANFRRMIALDGTVIQGVHVGGSVYGGAAVDVGRYELKGVLTLTRENTAGSRLATRDRTFSFSVSRDRFEGFFEQSKGRLDYSAAPPNNSSYTQKSVGVRIRFGGK